MNAALTVLKKLFTADYPYCIYCGNEYGVDPHTLACADCAKKLPAHDISGEVFGFRFYSCYSFEGPVQQLVHRYKYNGEKYLSEKLALIMKEAWERAGKEADVVTNVPLHRHKKKKRGYDQSALLAEWFSEYSGIPYTALVQRIKDTPSQTHFDREQRIENMKGAFAPLLPVENRRVLLIDDVLTTGSTASECARVLKQNGAAKVCILTFAQAK